MFLVGFDADGVLVKVRGFLRLALLVGAGYFVLIVGWDIRDLSLSRTPPNFPAPFHNTIADWATVCLNVFGSSAIFGAMTSLFLTVSGWRWPDRLDR